jgi:hypothetical protein
MKKSIFVVLGLLVIAMFLVGCAPQEELSQEDQQALDSELSQMSDDQLDQVIQEGETQDSAAIAGQAYRKVTVGKTSVKPSTALKTAYKVKFSRQHPILKKVELLKPRVLEILNSCSESPSCESPNYEVTSTNCGNMGELANFESCYTCSVKDEFRTQAECPAGWTPEDMGWDGYDDGVQWYGHGFSCFRPCALPGVECIYPPSLDNPCPVGFTYYYPDEGLGGGQTQYYCLMPNEPISTSLYGICNQCGSIAFGGNGANGDIFCAIEK